MTQPAILVVDDDPQMRELMSWALAEEGFLVEAAADGLEALERIAESPPGLAVLDVTLPGADGFAVADRLRVQSIPILMVTADGSAAQKAARMGAYRYLRKPFAMQDLLTGVREGFARAR
jgi:DNA-binding response OmpR family regulator